ncbi:cytochrome P450 [Aspergillus novoparasiticus]|uniref:Cytochrome P450 n=1 Tax=Aspergillus novoparasiticus TaxID=986946 RepID=A0A5N6F979_9EURO|nr:cytochrome P450 [Aspergillus novoparasiticus]
MDFASLLHQENFKVLETDLLQLGGSAALLGVLLHITIFRTSFCVENHIYNLLWLYATVVLFLFYAYFTITVLSPVQVLGRVALLTTLFNTSLISSISIYRLFFHRLHPFPGPFACKLTRFYSAFLAAKNIQYNVELKRLHKQYGDFVRTGPREISILRNTALPLIYGPQTGCPATSTIIDDEEERKTEPSVSNVALSVYEPRVIAQAKKLTAKVEANQGKPLDVTTWSMLITFDIMGDIGFGKDFGNLTTGKAHSAISAVRDHMRVIAVVSHLPWLLNMLDKIPGAAAGYQGIFKWCTDQVETKRKSWDHDKYPEDIISWILKAFIDNDVSAPPSEPALHDDSRVVVIAGSDTTASALANIIYFLAKHPQILRKLQAQLDRAMPNGPQSWTYDKAKTIGYIDDIIQESLRLRPSVSGGGYRVTPAEGLHIDEVFIPGDVNVFVPQQLIQTDERYYKFSKEFIPERWGQKKVELGTDKAPYFPFSLGIYGCVGKNLAMLSLRVAISTLTQRYDIRFAPGETGETFWNDALDTFTTCLPPLQVVFHPRAT